MRRVQFSDVVTVDDGDGTRSRSESLNNGGKFSSLSAIESPGRKRKSSGSISIDMDTSERDTSCGSDQDSTGQGSNQRRDRRQSLAAQILMAPTKWGQQKEYRQRKMSLHGKPIYFTAPSRRKHKVRKLMILVFNFLERPGGRSLSVLYHISTFLMVCACLVLTVFVTIPRHKERAQRILFVMEIILVVVFTTELIARVWSSGCRVRYQGCIGRLRFLRKPFCVIDVIVVMSSLIIILVGNDDHTFAATAMRGLRFLQILRMVRVDRRGGTWKLLGSVVYAHSKELITAWYIGFLMLIFASFLVYQAEKDENAEHFATFADSLWWGLITLTTIGYGDKTPKTWVGQLVASCFAILGISFFALPAGILGSGFALKVQEQHRQKHFARRRNPAAYLIQCFWRCYAADADSISTATWQPCLRGYIAFHNPNNKKNAFMRSRILSTTNTGKTKSRGNGDADASDRMNSCEDSVKDDFVKSAFEKLQGRFSVNSRPASLRKIVEKKEPPDYQNALELDNSDDDSSTKSCNDVITELTEQQKNAIRGFRMMKFCVAKRKFKEALRPYDVKDVIEQYSAGHIDMLARVKSLQSRVDGIVGSRGDTSPAFNRNSVRQRSSASPSRKISQFSMDPFFKGTTMNERLINVETCVAGIERKMDLLLAAFKKQERLIRRRKIAIREMEYSDEDDENGDNVVTGERMTSSRPFSRLKLRSPPPRRRSKNSPSLDDADEESDDTEAIASPMDPEYSRDYDNKNASDEVFIDENENSEFTEDFSRAQFLPSSTPLLESCQEYANSESGDGKRASLDQDDDNRITIKTTSFSAPNRIMRSAVS